MAEGKLSDVKSLTTSLQGGDLVMTLSPYCSCLSSHLMVAEGDILTVISIDGSGYWVWCMDNGQCEGHVPYDILRKILKPPKATVTKDSPDVVYSTIDGFSDDDDDYESVMPTGQFFKSLYTYKSAGVDDLAVREDDIVRLLNEDQKKEVDKKLFVESCSEPGKMGNVPSCFLRLLDPLEMEPYYVGKMNREGAEKILLNPEQPVHSFLVRQSERTPDYVISLKSQFEEGEVLVRHRKISEISGRFKAWSGHSFKTVSALVRAHCSSAGDNTLGKPYVRPDYIKLTISPSISPRPDRSLLSPTPSTASTLSLTPSLRSLSRRPLPSLPRE